MTRDPERRGNAETKEQGMFGKRNSPNASSGRQTDMRPSSGKTGAASGQATGTDRSSARTKAVSPAPYDAPRRVSDYALPGSRGEFSQGRPTESRKLVVGRDIALAGEIKSCELLVVEGLVEADLKGCRLLQIGETGVFKGSAEVAQAEISGRFEGDLTVTDRLFLRATGHIVGTLGYNEMEVERGGKMSGSIDELTEAPGRAKARRTAPGQAEAAPAPREEVRPEAARQEPAPQEQRTATARPEPARQSPPREPAQRTQARAEPAEAEAPRKSAV